MEQIFLSLINHIKSSLPQIQTIDEDYGQLEALDQESTDEYPLIFPAVLIDLPQAEWSNLQGKSQKGNVSIRIRLALDCYDDTHYGSNPETKIKERAELVHTLHKLLQSFRPVEDGDLNRTTSRFYNLNHGIKVYESTYNLTITDQIRETMKVAAPKVVVSVSQL